MPSKGWRKARGFSVQIVEFKGAGRAFGGRVALEGIDLTIRSGEIVALIGPSGGGKSTLVRLLAGSLRATTGAVCLDGVNMEALSGAALRKHRVGCPQIEQGGNLVSQLSVHDNVLAGSMTRWSPARILLSRFMTLERAPVRSLLEGVGLSDRQWDRTGDLSGGEQQRVAIVRALASSPTWLLADEPTAALDPVTAHDMAALLVSTARRHQAALVFTTHWMNVVTDHAERVVGIREGRVVLDEVAADVTSAQLDRLYEGSRERR